MSWGYPHQPKRLRGAWIASFEELLMRLDRGEWIWIQSGREGRAWHAAALRNWSYVVLKGRWQSCYECVLNPKNEANQQAAWQEKDRQEIAAAADRGITLWRPMF